MQTADAARDGPELAGALTEVIVPAWATPRSRRSRAELASARRRLDAELVRRGLLPSRERAAEAIRAQRVTVGGAPALKPARGGGAPEPIELVEPPPRYVSRGGEKLEAALVSFSIDPTGRRAIDCGASTGGFTDCLLQHGAAQVVAIDVGRGQLHERLRHDERVLLFERTSVRGIDPGSIGGPATLVVADLSFISLRTVLDDLLALSLPGADLVLLVKPQFEAGRAEAARGRGVISEPEVWRRVLGEVHDALVGREAAIMGAMTSPIEGAEGNFEFFVHARAPGAAPARRGAAVRPAELLDDVVAEAARRRAERG